MAKKIQLVGIALVLIGAIIIALSMTLGWNNSNLLNFGSVFLVIAGLITYIYAGKKVLGEEIDK